MKKMDIIRKGELLGVLLSFLLISCESSVTSPEDNSEQLFLSFDMRLPVDGNGYYHLDMNDNTWQTLHRVTGSVKNTQYRMENFWVEWESNLYWYLGDTLGYVVKKGLTDDLVYVNYDTTYVTWFNGFEVPTSNQISYSISEGLFHNMIAPVQSMIGDTMRLTAYWYDGNKDFYIVLD